MKILLVSGMDFSGKTSVIKKIAEKFSGSYLMQQKYLSIRDPLKEIRNSKKKYSINEWMAFWKQVVLDDISMFNERCEKGYYSDCDLILQDGLSSFKHLAMSRTDIENADAGSFAMLEEAIRQYPQMESVFLTASIEERKKRYEKRELSKRSYSDQLIFSHRFSGIECEYKKIVLECFPDTFVIDTSLISVDKVAEMIFDRYL